MKAIKRDDDKPCAAALWNAGEPSPRTCERCGLGPCPDGVRRRDGPGVKALPLDDPEVQAMTRLDAPVWAQWQLYATSDPARVADHTTKGSGV